MQLTIELAPTDPNYLKWRGLIRETVSASRNPATYLTVAETLGRTHKFKVQVTGGERGYPTQVILDFEQERDYTMFVLKCL
jgi:hypothetical protein